jgi:hypothetical protein
MDLLDAENNVLNDSVTSGLDGSETSDEGDVSKPSAG